MSKQNGHGRPAKPAATPATTDAAHETPATRVTPPDLIAQVTMLIMARPLEAVGVAFGLGFVGMRLL